MSLATIYNNIAMAKTRKERQKDYRERLYEAGYKQMLIWVPRESEGKNIKMDRKMFLKRIEAMTAGWSRTKLSRLLRDALQYIAEKSNQEGE